MFKCTIAVRQEMFAYPFCNSEERMRSEFFESIIGFKRPSGDYHLPDSLQKPLKQSDYSSIRLGCLDKKSTVATKGCAILVTKYLESMFYYNTGTTVEDIAILAEKEGYIKYAYRDTEIGCSQVCLGVSPKFFDEVVPYIYGIDVYKPNRMMQIIYGLWDNRISVLQLGYRSKNTEIEYVVVTGYDNDYIEVWDSEIGRRKISYEKILPRILNAWIYYDEDEDRW